LADHRPIDGWIIAGIVVLVHDFWAVCDLHDPLRTALIRPRPLTKRCPATPNGVVPGEYGRVGARPQTYPLLDGLLAQPGFAAAALDIEPRGEGTTQVGPFLLESRLVTHTDESYAVRITPADDPAGPGLVYSGDCGRAGDLAPLVHPGDTLLVEVAFGPGPVPVGDLHLDGPAVGALAAATRPGRVLLTHLQMRRDPVTTVASVRAVYDGPVALVADGETWAL